MKVIAIGVNHSGTTLVRTLSHLSKQDKKDIKIVAYDRNDNISFLGCGIALWVGGEISKPDGLFYATPELLQSEGIEVHMKHELLAVNNKEKKVLIKNLETNEEFFDTYDKLVIGVGTWPIIPSVPGLKNDDGTISTGINIVKLFQHAKQIKAIIDNSAIKNVVVVGAGYIGIELVEAFSRNNKKVTLIDIEDRIMPRYYDEEFTTPVQQSMEKAGVIIRTGEAVKEFIKENGIVTKVITDKNEYAVDMVLWAVGFNTETKILKDVVELGTRGAIKTNSYFQTSDPDIYAIGDCVAVHNNATKENANIALATTAVRTGLVTAFNIVRDNLLTSPGFQAANAISVFGWKMAGVGVSETVAKMSQMDVETVFFEDNDRPEFLEPHFKVKIKIVWEKTSRKIIGAQIASKANHTEVIYMFSLAIMKGLTIDELPLVDIFFLPHFNKPYNFVTLAGLKALGMDYFHQLVDENNNN